MYEEISDDMFIKEMQILWHSTQGNRNTLGNLITRYFGGDRAEAIKNKLMETKEEIEQQSAQLKSWEYLKGR